MSWRGLPGACAVVGAVLFLAACGTTGLPKEGSAATGKTIFAAKCASCHTLADAGSTSVIGPNLDDAFRQSRADGLGVRTIQSVVRGQIAYPVEDPTTGLPGMPANIVTGQDADSVALYVASVAGLPVRAAPGAGGAGGEAKDGKTVFAEAGCGGCHTLAAAGASGNVGPNLDETKPSKGLVVDRVTNGKGAMPPFKNSYSAGEIAAVADFVATNAGK